MVNRVLTFNGLLTGERKSAHLRVPRVGKGPGCVKQPGFPSEGGGFAGLVLAGLELAGLGLAGPGICGTWDLRDLGFAGVAEPRVACAIGADVNALFTPRAGGTRRRSEQVRLICLSAGKSNGTR